MPTTAIWFGRILILLGIIGYGYGLMNPPASVTALIPAVFGLVLMVLGHFSQMREDLRKHLMHVAVLVGLIGFVVPLGRILSKVNDFNLSFPFVLQAAMSVICLMFVILCVRSFITARRLREV